VLLKLEGAVVDPVEFEVYPARLSFGGTADGVGFAARSDVLGAAGKVLLPSGNEGLVQRKCSVRLARSES
jgi:hypothetical protein